MDGYGIMNRIDRDEIVKETGRTSWFTFKTNPKAKKPFKFIIDLMDYCITKSIGATFVEVFYPHDTQNDLGVKARKEVQKLGLTAPMVGHVGDGNFHSIVLYDPDDEDINEAAKKEAIDSIEFRRNAVPVLFVITYL